MKPQKPTSTDLRSIRKQQGGVLSDFAVRVGVDEATLSRIERGYVDNIRLRTALSIARVYGVPVESLEKAAA